MATVKITKKAVDAVSLPPEGKAAFLWDDTLKDFGLKVTAKGARSFIVQYRIGGRGAPTKRYTIGQHGSPWTVDQARERAKDLLELVRKKVDPIEEERSRLTDQQSRRAANERLAFSDYADDFVKKYARARKLRSADDIEAVFRRDLKPAFKHEPLTAMTRVRIRDVLEAIGERSPSAANKAHSWLRKMLGWAVERGDLASSPMDGMGPLHKSGQRKRKLEGDELRLVWEAADGLGYPFGSLVKLLLLTGQRLREVAGMQWSEVDLTRALWVIPEDRTKNGREHLCPLSPPAVELLKSVQPNAKARKGPVLTTNGKAPVSGFSKAKARLDTAVAKMVAAEAAERGVEPQAVAPWVLHDLRRSLASGCQALGVPIEHTEAVLNHVSGTRGGIVGVYQLHKYQPEKTAALNLWADKLASLLAEPGSASIHLLERRRA